MKHPARTLRALIVDLPEARPFLENRDPLRHAFIRAAGIRFFACLGPETFTVHDLVTALSMGVPTFSKYYADLDSLLQDLIYNHLLDLLDALSAIPPGAPDPQAARRARYLELTRNGYGGLTELHILLADHYKALPPILRAPIEELRDELGQCLAGPHADLAFRLLDAPEIAPANVESLLTFAIAQCEAHLAALHAKHPPPQRAAPVAPAPPAAADGSASLTLLSPPTPHTAAPAPSPQSGETPSPTPDTAQPARAHHSNEHPAPAHQPPPPARQTPPSSAAPRTPPPADLLRLTRSVADMKNPAWRTKPRPTPPRRPRQPAENPLGASPSDIEAALAPLISNVKPWGARAMPPAATQPPRATPQADPEDTS